MIPETDPAPSGARVDPDALSALESRLDYRFRDPDLLLEALTHTSYANEHRSEAIRHNERLEFLGDAVLDLIVSHMLLSNFPDAPEGDLSKLRSALVSEASLSEIGNGLGLGASLRLGKGEEASGGREKRSLLADAFEAVLGAVYLDAGIEPVRRILEAHFAGRVGEAAQAGLRDYKTTLQEFCQARGLGLPVYKVATEEGPDHDKTFRVELFIAGDRESAGTGKNKKEAEQDAARAALGRIAASGL